MENKQGCVKYGNNDLNCIHLKKKKEIPKLDCHLHLPPTGRELNSRFDPLGKKKTKQNKQTNKHKKKCFTGTSDPNFPFCKFFCCFSFAKIL